MNDTGSEHDEDLARRAKRGDRAAFENLVRRHKDDLYRFVRRYIGQADDAYDVLQDCMVSAWMGLSRYDPGRPFLPWLRTIALNKCRDFGRRQKVRRMFLKVFTVDRSLGDVTEQGEVSQQSMANEEDRLNRLDSAIGELSAFYKDPLLLTTVSGLSHQAAAEILKTTPKAIEMRLYRARQKLLKMLEPREG